jgi:hypothetical protein
MPREKPLLAAPRIEEGGDFAMRTLGDLGRGILDDVCARGSKSESMFIIFAPNYFGCGLLNLY